jgi:CheY-like chemotaxis protein
MKKILVAEDDNDVRKIVVHILRSCGYTVVEAVDGEDAIRVFERGDHFDLLIVDFYMPGLDGSQVAEAARAIKPGVKVLFLSGDDEGKPKPILAKPFTPQALTRTVREVLEAAT